MRNIIVVPYNKSWKTEFEKIKNYIWPAIKDISISVEHVGSTSVEGLYAKPIIDMNIVIERDMLPLIINRLADIGYAHEGDLGIKDREAFGYAGKPHLMTHHLYVCPKDSAEHMRQTAFRDWLRTHPEDCEKYSNIKLEMAKKFPHDIDNYIKGKEPVVMEIYKKCGIAPYKFSYRKADINDADILAKIRSKFLAEANDTEAEREQMEAANRAYFEKTLADDSFVAWLALEGNKIVATSGLSFYAVPPHHSNPSRNVAFVMNMYTLPEYRRQGLATRLLEMIVDEAKSRGYKKITLSATEMGRPLYEKFGFKDDSGAMVIYIK